MSETPARTPAAWLVDDGSPAAGYHLALRLVSAAPIATFAPPAQELVRRAEQAARTALESDQGLERYRLLFEQVRQGEARLELLQARLDRLAAERREASLAVGSNLGGRLVALDQQTAEAEAERQRLGHELAALRPLLDAPRREAERRAADALRHETHALARSLAERSRELMAALAGRVGGLLDELAVINAAEVQMAMAGLDGIDGQASRIVSELAAGSVPAGQKE
jgi:hypothetical protein